MKYTHILSIFLLTLLAGCTNNETEIPSQEEPSRNFELTASADTPSSRIGFDKAGVFYWNYEDKIGVSLSSNTTKFTEKK